MSDARFGWDKWTAGLLVVVGTAYYGYAVTDVIFNARTWVDEVTYLVKSLNYVTGKVSPYSDVDPTWYMPLYFYQLGLWQDLIEPGMQSGRILSAGIGFLSGVLVFDIVRRLTGSLTASAFAGTALLSVPSVVFYFGTANPISTVSLLTLVAVWISVTGLSHPTMWRSVLLGFVFGLLYFYRQNMLLLLIALLPLHLLGVRENRLQHSLLILGGLLLVAVPIVAVFPDRLLSYAIRLPVITPLLSLLPFIDDPLLFIQANTVGDVGLNLAFDKIVFEDLVDAYALPYAGIILAACAVILLAPEELRILWLAPFLFFFLSATHYIGSLDYCQTCILPYTASFAGIGAISIGLACSIISHVSKNQVLPSSVIVVLFALTVLAYNETASGMATRDEYKYYPQAMLTEPRPIPEQEETRQLAGFLRMNTDPFKPILPIHDLITVPYALALADRTFPVQALNLRHSYRELVPGLSEQEAQTVNQTLEREGLWTDETMDRWISDTYDTIVFQVDPRNRDADLEQVIERSFSRIASTGFRGWNVHIYQRQSPDQATGTTTP